MSGKSTDASTQSGGAAEAQQAPLLSADDLADVARAGAEARAAAEAYKAAHPELDREVHALITACVEAKVPAAELPAFAAAFFAAPK
jgi:hypothetical protein